MLPHSFYAVRMRMKCRKLAHVHVNNPTVYYAASACISCIPLNLLGAHVGRGAPARPHQRRDHDGCGAKVLRRWHAHAVRGVQALQRRKGTPSIRSSTRLKPVT